MRDEIDRVAKLLMDAWAKAEPDHNVTKYPVSYVATFADMARAVVEDQDVVNELIISALIDHGCDCDHDGPHEGVHCEDLGHDPCLGCLVDRALRRDGRTAPGSSGSADCPEPAETGADASPR